MSNNNMFNVELEEILYGYVESFEEKKNGNYPVHLLQINTQKGRFPFKFWDLSKKDKHPKTGDYVKIKVFDVASATNELQTYKSISLDSLKNKPCHCDYIPINEEDVPEEYKKIRIDRSAQIAFAAKLLQDSDVWIDKNNYKFLVEVLKSNLEKFKTAPAAIGHHHNYRGGLLVHSSEVFSNCCAIVNAPINKFYEVDCDVLYLSAWLHDLGKIEIYEIDEQDVIKINSEKENMIGHTIISNNIFVENAKKFGLKEEFINKVSHCILSHHKRPKWGAARKPMTKEAQILCEADFISSRISV